MKFPTRKRLSTRLNRIKKIRIFKGAFGPFSFISQVCYPPCMAEDSIKRPKIPPLGWGNDNLSEFLEWGQFNQLATFDKKKDEYKVLKTIDDCFEKIGDHLLNPQKEVPALFVYGSHSAFRASASLVMTTQIPESFPLMRVCIESAGYALKISENTELENVWMDRENNEEALKKCRNEFSYKKIYTEIHNKDKRLGEIFEEFYERSITFGSHPNVLSLTSRMKIEETPENKSVLLNYYEGNSLNLSHGLKSLAQVGLCSLYIFQHIFKERFMLLGLREELQKLKEGL